MANYNDVALASANLEVEYLRKQLNDLRKELKNVDRAKKLLKNEGFFVDNLWHINDVFNVRECDDDQAMQALENAFACEYLNEAIHDSISSAADFLDLPLKH
jgi:hypothetical protein